MDEVHCYDCGADEGESHDAMYESCACCGEPVCPDCSWLHADIHHPEGAAPQGEPAEAGGR